MENNSEKITRLIFLHLLGTLSEEEKNLLNRWCMESKANRNFFESICSEDRFSKEFLLYMSIDSKSALKKFENLLADDSEERILIVKKTGRKRLISYFLRYAAIFLLPLLVLGIYFWQNEEVDTPIQQDIIASSRKAVLTLADGERLDLGFLNERENVEQDGGYNEKLQSVNAYLEKGKLSYQGRGKENVQVLSWNSLETDCGGEYQLVLEDGTKVFLNAESKLKYPVVFGEGVRKVKLEGEAYFEVAKDAERPFIVEMDKVAVKVYGTKFNVNAYPGNDVKTVLEEGSIGIQIFGNEQVLLPGEMAVYEMGSKELTVKKVDTKIYTSWKDGLFKFEEERLEDIMITLSRWYGVEVFYYNNSLRDELFSGDLKRYGSIEEHLKMLELTTNIVFEIKGNNVFVGRK